MRRFSLALLSLALFASAALAGEPLAFIASTPPTSDNSNRIATTQWVNTFVNAGLPLPSGQIFVGSVGNVATPQALGAGILTWLATPNSANLRASISDETGTGLAYFQGGDIGTPSAGVATNITALNATQLTTGTIPAARTNGHQNGTATNDNAAAGEVGEYNENTLVNASAISLTNNTPVDVITVSLGAGDYDVWGVALFTYGGSTVITQAAAWISTTSNTFPSVDCGCLGTVGWGAGKTGGQADFITTPAVRQILLTGPTTVRLEVRGLFTTSTASASGTIKWRRRR